MTQFTDRGLTEIASGLTGARTVLRRRRGSLQVTMAGMEAEIAELEKIESAVGMALEVLKSAAAAREQVP